MVKSLQVYRALAALIVVLFHLQEIVTKYSQPALYSSVWAFGRNGVQFFFVLSGFIIYHVHARELGRRELLGSYLFKRVTRVYPLYWIITLVLIPFWFSVPEFGQPYHRDLSALVCSLLLLPQAHFPHLEVGWTLVHEVLFYAMFAFLFLSPRLIYLGLVWAGGIIWYAASGVSINYLADFFFSLNNLLFLAGVVIAICHRKYQRPPWLAGASILIGAALFVAGAILRYHGILAGFAERTVWFGLSSALLVFGCGVPQIENRFFNSRLLLFLGAASYSIYLVHFPLLSVEAKVFRMAHLSSFLSPFAFWLLLLILAVLGGCALHILVEAPLQAAMKRWGRRRYGGHAEHNTENAQPRHAV